MKRITNGTKIAWDAVNTANNAVYTYYGNLAPKIRNSVLPFLLASMPVVILSITGSIIVLPLVIFLSTVLIFYIAKDMDEVMFSFTKQESRRIITIPLTGFICIWGMALVMMSHGRMMNAVVGPYCSVLLVACAPAYRWNVKRVKRKVPLWVSLSLTGTVAIAASIFYIDK